MSQFIEMFGNPLSTEQKFPLKKLGDCCILNPRRPSLTLKDIDKVSFVPMPSVSENGHLQDVADEEYGKVRKGFTYFEEGDVLFAKITPCMENGKGAIAQNLTNNIGMGSTEFHIFRPIEGVSNPYWLLTLTRMPIFRERASKNMSGTGGQKRVGAVYLENFMVGLPPIEEQNRFADIYIQADKSEFDGVKSQFIEMFGDPIMWQDDNTLPQLSESVDVISGFPFNSEMFNTNGSGISLIRIRDVQRGFSETYTTESFDEQYRIRKGELLIGMDGMFDIARWKDNDAALNQRVCCLRMKSSENDTFIQYLVQPILKHIENGTNATTVKHISTKQINAIRVPVASIEQKMKFASIAEQADKSESKLRKSIESIDKVIKS